MTWNRGTFIGILRSNCRTAPAPPGRPGTLTAALAPPVTATRRPVRPTPTPEDAARDVPPTVTGVRSTDRGSVIVTRTRVGHIGRLPSARRIDAL